MVHFGATRFENAIEDRAGVGVSVHDGELVC